MQLLHSALSVGYSYTLTATELLQPAVSYSVFCSMRSTQLVRGIWMFILTNNLQFFYLNHILMYTYIGAKTDAVFNVAVCELAGHLPIYSKCIHPRGQGYSLYNQKFAVCDCKTLVVGTC